MSKQRNETLISSRSSSTHDLWDPRAAMLVICHSGHMSVQLEFLGNTNVHGLHGINSSWIEEKKRRYQKKDNKKQSHHPEKTVLNIKATFKPKSVSLSISESKNPTDWGKNYQDHHPDFEGQPQISAARDISMTWSNLMIEVFCCFLH